MLSVHSYRLTSHIYNKIHSVNPNYVNFSSKRCQFIQIIKIFVCTLLNDDDGGSNTDGDDEVMIIINVSNANKSNENIFLLQLHLIV